MYEKLAQAIFDCLRIRETQYQQRITMVPSIVISFGFTREVLEVERINDDIDVRCEIWDAIYLILEPYLTETEQAPIVYDEPPVMPKRLRKFLIVLFMIGAILLCGLLFFCLIQPAFKTVVLILPLVGLLIIDILYCISLALEYELQNNG